MQSGSTLPETQLIRRVQQSIDAGRLPLIVPPLISASYGAGSVRCAVCDLVIRPDQVMYEIGDPRLTDELFSFHFGCYVIWQRECAQRFAAGA
jgi:LSD1 zinc finger